MSQRKGARRLILLNMPIVASICIIAFYFLTDRGVITFARTEEGYGYFVLLLLPLAVALIVAQLYLWGRSRGSSR